VRIANDILIISVLIAIDLDNQLCLEAAEVRNIRADRDLAAEVRALCRHTMAQVPPQLLFGLGLAVAQDASA
jgi:hypothetical protein